MSREVLISIRQALGATEYDDSLDQEIAEMSPDEQFRLYCEWNGLLGGWSDRLKEVALEIFNDEFVRYEREENQYPRNNNKGPFAPL